MQHVGGWAVVVRNLRVSFGDVEAVRDLSLSLPLGEISAVLGPNGAGKTTTMEVCAGLTQPDSGQVDVLGVDPWHALASHRARIGVMLQSGGIWSTASPKQALSHLAGFYQQPWPVADLLGELELTRVARTPFRRLSGGEQQRVKLAAALIGRPELLLLDEPTAGLDPSTRLKVWDLLRSLRASGVTVALSTHSFQEAEALAQHHVIIHEGRVAAMGTLQELNPATGGESLWFTTSNGLNTASLELACPPNTRVAVASPGRYRLDGTPITPELMATVTAWCANSGVVATDLQVRGATLEDVYLAVTGYERSRDRTGSPA
ncbi:MAG: ABC transporter ATP-binding protein [Actinobacteria bacterium]|nr:ABC transporter ATP-binding protein [Actinomycetota bacterium]